MDTDSILEFCAGEHKGSIQFDYIKEANYAMARNRCRLLLACVIANDSDAPWHNIEVAIDGETLRRSSIVIDTLAPGARADAAKDISIDIDAAAMGGISESIDSAFTLTVTVDGAVALERKFPLALMPFDQWLGLRVRPDLTSAFVTPNHPILSRVAVAASKILEKWTGSGMLDEYQSQDPNRARQQVAAIYEALRAEGLIYATPPASFESAGQRIRLVDKVLNEKLGTCIDLSLLVASCLEAIGIHPLLIFTRGHCFAGAWLVKDTCGKTVNDDPDFLLKSSADGINEIVVFETTCITNTAPVPFEDAVSMAQAKLRAESEFELFVDVAHCRICGVKPLPARVRKGDEWVIENEGAQREEATTKVKKYDRYDLGEYDKESAGITKYTLWERKLLDFSLRNNLLNMRLGKRIIPLVSFSIDKLEDCLQAGQTFQVLPFPLDSHAQPNEKGIYDSALYPQLESIIIDDAAHRKVRSFLGENDLKDALKYVYRASRTSLEENGANNLYIVFGVLKWYESDRSRQPHFAPILLLPISIVRKGGLAGYEIRTRDEDIMLNVTLAELLKQQHGIDLKALEELPKDESGVDVKRIFAFIRDKIKDKKGWNVFDESLIGLFSFNKFVMWNDIHTNADKLHSNEIISSLVDGKLNIQDPGDDIDAKDADASAMPSQYAIPIDVDSSQLEAIIASGAGRSFILHGPPGTGKSQTITNMIANALYHGKRVLFVAEKMAALEVVQSRLAKIGLAPFCLELHSNKVTKQHFLSQMEAALEVARRAPATSYAAEAEQLYALRKELIGIISAVHAKNASGLSLYDCINAFIALDGEEMDIDISLYAAYSMRDVESACEKIKAIDAVTKVAGLPSANPLVGLDLLDGSAEAEELLRKEMPRFASMAAKWTESKKALERDWDLRLPDSLAAAQWLLSLAQMLHSGLRLNIDLLLASMDAGLASSVRSSLEAGRRAEEEAARLAADYSKAVLSLSSQSIDGEWRQIAAKWFLPRWLAKRSFIKRMSAYKAGFCAEDVDGLVASLKTIEENNEKLAARSKEISRMFGDSESWAGMTAALDRLPELKQIIDTGSSLAKISRDEMAEMIAKAAGYGKENTTALLDMANCGIDADASLCAILNVAKPHEQLNGWAETAQAMMAWHKGLGAFRQRFLWCRQARELDREHLGCAAKYVAEDGKTGAEAAKAFAKAFYHLMASRIINSDQRLRYFNGILFEEAIEKYRQAAARFQALSKEELYCRLASNIPSITMAAHENSEIGILKRNIKNGGRGTSIRKLNDSIPTLLQKLCPCMLMSPISVAQYISLDNDKFDLVIFDEASQMPTSEAVGAIARGKALVVVGDPKQMPPTSFFSTSAVGEDEAAIDDMESILDDCISLSIPSKHLSWHYRSRHESLIAFSNAQYYDGRLTTFPSTDDQVTKVTLRSVKGVYDKGRSRSNQAEAQAIVDEVVRRLSDPALSKQSIGIVSFSKVQQDKIEDLLTDTLAKRPDLEALAYESSEPIFIKNLENVQGDERDVILFSVGYGPDANGKVSMNFGPLNNAGGERRLNVAVSRARCEMVVFTSLQSADIDLRRSSALGVEGLKKFLEYAESGRAETPASQSLRDSGDSIAKQVAAMLRSHGYQTRLNVGRSQFRVDVAVANPDNPSEFMLGILCDGPAYYATKTVRDREIVQPEVLKRLNWNIMRVWTLDWFERREEVEKAILDTLAKIAAGKAEELKQESGEAPKPYEPVALAQTPAIPEIATQEPSEEYAFANLDYAAAPVDDINACRPRIKLILNSLVDTEAPITNSLIYKRVVKALGLTRITPRVQAIIDELAGGLGFYIESNGALGGLVYWRSASQAADFKIFRTNSGREISEIPLAEIVNAMRYVIDQQIAIDKESLKRLTSNMLGFTRMGNNISQATEHAVCALAAQNYVAISADKVSKN